MDEKLSLREFEQRMESLRIWLDSQLTHIRELEGVRGAALTKALELQAEEIARRLEELNHAHKNAMENWARSLPREIFESVLIDWNKWRDQVNAAIIEGRQQTVDIAKSAAKVAVLEADMQSAKGAMTLIRWVGVVGIGIALLSFLRMVRVVP